MGKEIYEGFFNRCKYYNLLISKKFILAKKMINTLLVTLMIIKLNHSV